MWVKNLFLIFQEGFEDRWYAFDFGDFARIIIAGSFILCAAFLLNTLINYMITGVFGIVFDNDSTKLFVGLCSIGLSLYLVIETIETYSNGKRILEDKMERL